MCPDPHIVRQGVRHIFAGPRTAPAALRQAAHIARQAAAHRSLADCQAAARRSLADCQAVSRTGPAAGPLADHTVRGHTDLDRLVRHRIALVALQGVQASELKALILPPYSSETCDNQSHQSQGSLQVSCKHYRVSYKCLVLFQPTSRRLS